MQSVVHWLAQSRMAVQLPLGLDAVTSISFHTVQGVSPPLFWSPTIVPSLLWFHGETGRHSDNFLLPWERLSGFFLNPSCLCHPAGSSPLGMGRSINTPCMVNLGAPSRNFWSRSRKMHQCLVIPFKNVSTWAKFSLRVARLVSKNV